MNMDIFLAIIAVAILLSWWMTERDIKHIRKMQEKYGDDYEVPPGPR